MWLFLTFFLFASRVYAETVYFDFLSLPYTKENSVLEVEMFFDLEDPSYFRVMPVSKYISSSKYWSESPTLEKNMTYNLNSNNFIFEDLQFLVLDVRTSEVFSTPKHKIYGRAWLDTYIKRLNESLARMIK